MSIFYFIVSQISFGITNVLWKKPQEHTGTLNLILARSFCTALIFGVFTLCFGDFSKWNWHLGAKTIAFCIVNYFGLFFYLKSLQQKKISEIVGLSKIGVIIGLCIGIFYFQEEFNFLKILVIILILFSVFLIENNTNTKAFFSQGFFIRFFILSFLVIRFFI